MARDYTITQQGYSRTFTVTTGGGGGAGNMLAATYDPTSVEGDAFAMDNMVEGADTKVLTAAERAAITSNSNQLTNHSGRLSSVEALAGANSFAVQVNDAAITSHTSNTSNPHSVTAAQVGLGSADNTSDADKPVSTATQTALDDLKSFCLASFVAIAVRTFVLDPLNAILNAGEIEFIDGDGKHLAQENDVASRPSVVSGKIAFVAPGQSIDVAPSRGIRMFDDATCTGIFVNDTDIYVGSFGDGCIYRSSKKGVLISKIQTDIPNEQIQGLCLANGFIYCGSNAGTVYKLTLAGSVVETFPGIGVNGIVHDPVEGVFWCVTGFGSVGTVTKRDEDDLTVLLTIETALDDTDGICIKGDNLLITQDGPTTNKESHVIEIEKDGSVVSTTKLPHRALEHIAWDGDHIWITDDLGFHQDQRTDGSGVGMNRVYKLNADYSPADEVGFIMRGKIGGGGAGTDQHLYADHVTSGLNGGVLTNGVLVRYRGGTGTIDLVVSKDGTTLNYLYDWAADGGSGNFNDLTHTVGVWMANGSTGLYIDGVLKGTVAQSVGISGEQPTIGHRYDTTARLLNYDMEKAWMRVESVSDMSITDF